jgi:hypothetical protein
MSPLDRGTCSDYKLRDKHSQQPVALNSKVIFSPCKNRAFLWAMIHCNCEILVQVPWNFLLPDISYLESCLKVDPGNHRAEICLFLHSGIVGEAHCIAFWIDRTSFGTLQRKTARCRLPVLKHRRCASLTLCALKAMGVRL